MIDSLATGLIFQPLNPSRNRIQHNIIAADPTYYPDRTTLKYLLKIQVPESAGSSTFIDLITIPAREKPPVVDGITTRYDGAIFTINHLLDGILQRTKPAFRQNYLSVIAKLAMPYTLIEYVEDDGDNISTSSPISKWLIKSGFNESDYDQWGSRFFSVYLAETRKFLTWQPDSKRITPTQEEYLYFLLNFTPAPSTVKLRVLATYTDASQELFTPLTLSAVQFGQIICVPVGTHILTTNPAKTLHSYKVWLSNTSNERLSEARTYYLDYRTVAQERFLLFNNSFHTYDTLRLTGASIETLKVQRYTAYRERPSYLPPEFTEFFVVDRAADRELIISTGFFERNVANQLRYTDEVLMSEEWYLITDRNHEPLELLTNTLVDHQDNQDLVARQLLFRYVRQEKSFSRLPVAPAYASRPTYWKAVGVTYLLNSYGKRTGYVRANRIALSYVDDNTSVFPYTEKVNTPGNPDYVSEYIDTNITPSSTPHPNVLLSRATTFNRNNCPVGYFGGPATIVVAAGKYGGESAGIADASAEAEYTLLNTQDYANTYGTCILVFKSAAISRLSTFTKAGCSGSDVGSRWTITVAAEAYTSTISQADADAQANAYANSLDTQANADLYGSCVAAQFYWKPTDAGKANYRLFVSKSGYWAFSYSGLNMITTNTVTDIQDTPSTGHAAKYNYSGSGSSITASYQVYVNGTLISSGTNVTVPGVGTSTWYTFFSLPAHSAGDMVYIKIF